MNKKTSSKSQKDNGTPTTNKKQTNSRPPQPSSTTSLSPTLMFVAGSVLGIAVTLGLVFLFMGKTSSFPASPNINTVGFTSTKTYKLELEQTEQFREQGKSIKDHFQALEFYNHAISNFPPNFFTDPLECKPPSHECAELSLARAALLDEAGDAHHNVKQYTQAAELHRAALMMKEKQVQSGSGALNGVIYSHVALANDLFKGGNIAEALELVQQAEAFPNLPQPLLSMLLRLKSLIHECDGDFVTALHQFEQGLKISPPSSHPIERQVEFMHVHRDLLRKARSYHAMPTRVAQAMEAKEKEIEGKLLEMGPWVNPLQLPKVFLPNLTSKPWHNVNDYPQLLEAYEIVKKAYPLLREEYYQLAAKSLLSQEGECINDLHKGKWGVHDITSYWVRKDETGCSIAAPHGCHLFQQLKSTGFPVIRGGYSALAPGAWLRPHFGVTNGQLKFHLGLVVPKKEVAQTPQQCAFMRVAQEIRGWEEGAITFFDDSYEHEVWNNCTSDRIVFQVVFVHPDLPPSSSREDIFRLPSH